MTRKDELEERATKFFDACDRYTYHDGRKALRDMLLQVERECWEKIESKIEAEMGKENESTDDQIWEIRDWCCDQLKEVER